MTLQKAQTLDEDAEGSNARLLASLVCCWHRSSALNEDLQIANFSLAPEAGGAISNDPVMSSMTIGLHCTASAQHVANPRH